MEPGNHSYVREFWRSPHHGWLALCTVGAGFASGHALPLIAGATAYAVAWIYVPDLPFFRGWVDKRHADELQKLEDARIAEFQARRDHLLSSLSPERLARYRALALVCHNIETATIDSPIQEDSGSDPRLRKLDELMWTYLRLLTIEESLARFLETEMAESVPNLAKEAEDEIFDLQAGMEKLKERGDVKAVEGRQRLLGSRMERLEVLRKRLERSSQARENLDLVVAEQERLDQQIKLIRADAVAMKNAGALTARIDATVEHLDQTNRWLAEMDEFKDIAGDLPTTERRVGFASKSLTMQPERAARRAPQTRQRQ